MVEQSRELGPPQSIDQERLAYCEGVLPELMSVTGQYFDDSRPTPYLEALASGGIILNESAEIDELALQIDAASFRDTLMSDKFPEIGIPEDIVRNGQMWVVSTNELGSNSRPIRNSDRSDHSFMFWDNSQWHVRRLNNEMSEAYHAGKTQWSLQWEASEARAEELNAIKTVARQTRDVHGIAQHFGRDQFKFQETLLSTIEDPELRDVVALGLIPPGATAHVGGRNISVSPEFMSKHPHLQFYVTGYQNVRLQDTAAKLQQGRSFTLDSGGIMDASYHRGSLPSTPEMLEDGENIPVIEYHAPVPPEFLEPAA